MALLDFSRNESVAIQNVFARNLHHADKFRV